MKRNVHILIVDDNLKNLQITAQILKDEGYLISLTQDGQSALEYLMDNPVDLILLDIMMPGINGLDTCRMIKKNDRWKDIPIIFLTAKNQTDDLIEGFKAGAVDYITKPFVRDELLVRVKTHVELFESRKAIMEMNRTRDKLYSIIAHDLRSPFSSIAFTINAIADGIFDPCSELFQKVVRELEHNATNTSSLLDNLLEWTRLQQNRISLDLKKSRLAPVLFECKHLLSPVADKKNITLELEILADPVAVFDHSTMYTVFRNLITNAIKFTPENGLIRILAEKNGTGTQIKIIDNGKGISKETIEKIFEKKELYTTLGTKKERGSGLGLVLIQDFIEANQGKIAVESEEGKGSIFSVFLPAE